MLWLWLGLAAVLLVLAASFVCFYIVFYAPRRPVKNPPEYDIPPGKIYEPYRDAMIGWMKEVRAMPFEAVSIRSFDGLRLTGRYYEHSPGSPVEIMFHGYRGNADRDLCGGVQRCFRLGHSALLVDQRTSGGSEGHVITFGIREHRDCIAWAEFAAEKFGPARKLILTGISMGAATVLMAAGKPLPSSVVGVLADCGYTSPRAIIQKCTRQLHLPPRLLYPFVRLGALLFGGFDPDSYSPLEAMKTARLPILFFHGDSDDFVPCAMSRENHDAASAPRQLILTPGAGHGLCYVVDAEGYLAAMGAFGRAHGWD